MTPNKDHKILNFPKKREMTHYLLNQANKQHTIHGMTEVDVTESRSKITAYKKKTKNPLSFSAFLINCHAKAIDENKIMHAMYKNRRKLVIYDNVDVGTFIHTGLDWTNVPVVYVIRNANNKNLIEINQEIQELKRDKEVYLNQQNKTIKKILRIPRFLRNLVACWKYYHDPEYLRKYGGTTTVSSIGMFIDGGGWGIPLIGQTTSLTIGGMELKPKIINNKIEKRVMLSLTFSFNHDIIDGAPATSFVQRIKELIEEGYQLDLFEK
jgi:pyruvate/2-oxoglutarate dehydrogenase complex dihydrolipoamide acyltransferase (E2) component